MKARIEEVFYGTQGEGLYLGEEQLFVRFYGCNLSCKFCDTRQSRFIEYEPDELFREIKLYSNGYHSISFTGGEPLLHKDFLKEVLALTKKHGYKNYLDTNGTLAGELKEVISYLDIVAMDLKFPSSTGMGELWGLHRKFLTVAREKEVFIKAIICRSTEEEDLRQAVRMMQEINSAAVLILQPNSLEVFGELEVKIERFKEIALANGITTCVIPQMHKIVGIK